MKVLFLGIGSEQLGISHLAAIVKANGHEIDLVFSAALFHDRYNLEIPKLHRFFDDTSEIIQEVIKRDPDVIAFGCLTSTFQWAISVIKGVKAAKPNIKVVLGGVHVSAVPETCLSYPEVDYAVVGEGEVAIVDILNDIAAGGFGKPINNTQYIGKDGQLIKGRQVGFHQDLDALPLPEKEMWEPYINMKTKYLIMASRGCPYQCTFCFNNFFARLPEGTRGKYVRNRSVEHVIAELKWAKERYHIKYVDFQDDVFTVNKQWVLEFCEAYKKEINLPFNCLIHAKYIDEERAKALSEAGCEWIQMGIQTMDEEYKNQHLQRREKNSKIIEALKLMQKYKLKVKVDQMLALPGEDISAQEKALTVYREVTPTRIQIFWTTFLPGTDMYKEAIEAGEVSDEAARRLDHGEDFYFFRNQDNIKDPYLIKQYANYEFIYRVFPALPNFLKQRISANFIDKIPRPILNLIGQTVDVYFGFRTINKDFIAYADYYLKNILKVILKKFGYKKYRLTKIYKDIPNPHFVKKEQMEDVFQQ